jgi:serpin B
MKTITIFLLAFTLFNVLSCTDNESNPNNIPVETSETKAAIIESNNNFAYKIFSSLINNDDDGTNIFISPLSMYYALSMAANGANGETYESFKQALGHDFNKEEMLEDIKGLYEQLILNDNKLVLEIANSMWADEAFNLKEKYSEELVQYFYSEAQRLDFAKTESVDIINNWIAEKTHNKIRKMLNEISPDEVLFLINAIYFKGDWLYTFNEEANTRSNFRKENNTDISVDYMNQKSDFYYFSNTTYSAVQLPYMDTNYVMTVFLPGLNKSTNDIVNLMSNGEWNKICNEFITKTVSLSIPKFKFEYGVRNIKNELIDIGLSVAFTSNADFSGISDLDLKISRVLHKAFIDVNEKGSEAAAATIVGVELTSIDTNQVYFTADHPFIFTISEKSTNTVLFIGKVAEPVYAH